MNNTQVDNVKDIEVVMPMYNLVEYSHIYFRTSGSLWQCYTDEPDELDNASAIIDFLVNNNNNVSFKFKEKITSQTGTDSTKYVEILVPLKYLSNFWRTLEIPLINCEINVNFILTWYADFFIVVGTVANQVPTFEITDTKLMYVSVVTVLTQNNGELLKQLKSGFEIIINWNRF